MRKMLSAWHIQKKFWWRKWVSVGKVKWMGWLKSAIELKRRVSMDLLWLGMGIVVWLVFWVDTSPLERTLVNMSPYDKSWVMKTLELTGNGKYGGLAKIVFELGQEELGKDTPLLREAYMLAYPIEYREKELEILENKILSLGDVYDWQWKKLILLLELGRLPEAKKTFLGIKEMAPNDSETLIALSILKEYFPKEMWLGETEECE